MSLRRLFTVARKETIHARRDVRTMIIVAALPLLQLILLGYTTMNDITNVPLAVCDLSRSAASRELISAFSTAQVFAITRDVASEDELARLLEGGQIKAGLVIPPDYADTLARRQKAQIAFYLDGSNPVIALTAVNSAELIAQSKSSEIVQRQLESYGGQRAGTVGLDVRPRVWYNPNLTRANFIVPALIGLVMQNFMTTLVAGAIVREREMGTMEQLIATPLRSLELILGKVLPYVGVALLAALEIMVIGLLWFRVPVKGSFLLLILYSLFFLVAMLSWAVLVSAVARTDQEARMMNALIVLPSLYLSGMFFPRASMPPVLQAIGNVVPLTHFLVMVRAVVLKGVGIGVVIPQITALAAFAAVAVWLATMSFKRKLV